MMRRNKYTKGNLRVCDAEAYRIEDGGTDGFGEEESQIRKDRLRNKVTVGRKKAWARMARIAKIGLRKENPQMRERGEGEMTDKR